MNMVKTHLTVHALWLRFIITWVLLHSGILLVLTVGWMIWPLLAFIIIPGSYSILLRGDHSHPGKLGLSTCVGGVISLVVLTVIKGVVLTVIKGDGLFMMGVIGMTTGVANIPLLPWRGVRTAPLINTLGGIVAYTVCRRLGSRTRPLVTSAHKLVPLTLDSDACHDAPSLQHGQRTIDEILMGS